MALTDLVHADGAAARGRWLGYIYALAAVLTPVTLLAPHGPGYDNTGLIVIALVAAVVAIALLWRGERLGGIGVHAIVALGSVLTTAVIRFTAGLPNAATSFYVWVVLFAFYFFGLRKALGHLALVLVLYALSAVWTKAEYPLAAHTIAMSTTLIGSGVIVAALRVRINHLLGELVQTARIDELTRLPNRRAFNEELGRALARAQRSGDPLTLAMLDLDHFKQINDRFGHPTGDRVLQRTGKVLRKCLREGDVAARVGGEEFALILPSVDVGAARVIAERARRAVAEKTDGEHRLTVSVGIADSTAADRIDVTELMRRADAALYAAKAGGRNRVLAHEPSRAHTAVA